MHPANCPEWEYAHHPRKSIVLQRTVPALLERLRNGSIDTLKSAVDSREAHHALFRKLAPSRFTYFAGHYRGKDFRCLKFYEVCIQSDPRVGAAPGDVAAEMGQLAQDIQQMVNDLDAMHQISDMILAPREKLRRTVAAACKVFVEFLRIHPYANGNGHMGRFIVWCIVGRYQYWPQSWPVDPRPPEPFYSAFIPMYRDGNTQPLERFVLQCIIGSGST